MSHPGFSIYLRPSVQQQGHHVGVASLGGHMERRYPILTRQGNKGKFTLPSIQFNFHRKNKMHGCNWGLTLFKLHITLRVILIIVYMILIFLLRAIDYLTVDTKDSEANFRYQTQESNAAENIQEQM